MFVKNLLNLRKFYSYHVLSLYGLFFIGYDIFSSNYHFEPYSKELSYAIIFYAISMVLCCITLILFIFFSYLEIFVDLRIKNKFILENKIVAFIRTIGFLGFIYGSHHMLHSIVVLIQILLKE